jgi:hypothetical protein
LVILIACTICSHPTTHHSRAPLPSSRPHSHHPNSHLFARCRTTDCWQTWSPAGYRMYGSG